MKAERHSGKFAGIAVIVLMTLFIIMLIRKKDNMNKKAPIKEPILFRFMMKGSPDNLIDQFFRQTDRQPELFS